MVVLSFSFSPLDSCRKKCSNVVSLEQQKIIFKHYWNLGNYVLRRTYIAGLIDVKRTKSKKRDAYRNRPNAFTYFVEINGDRKVVCRVCFESMFKESEGFIKTSLKMLVEKHDRNELEGKRFPKTKSRKTSFR